MMRDDGTSGALPGSPPDIPARFTSVGPGGSSGSLRRLAAAFESLARAASGSTWSEPGGRPHVMEALCAEVVSSLPTADGASVTVLRGKRFTTAGATSEWVRQADDLQYRLGSGPCVDAIVEDALFRPADLAHDDRWPEFGALVSQDLGVRSMLSYRLYLGLEGVAAGLNVYSRRCSAFTDDDVSVGLMTATLAAFTVTTDLAVANARNLEVALQTNREIGTAVGILMAQHRVTSDEAFGLLRLASQDANRKLRDVAADVVETGTLELRLGRLRVSFDAQRAVPADTNEPRHASAKPMAP